MEKRAARGVQKSQGREPTQRRRAGKGREKGRQAGVGEPRENRLAGKAIKA